MEEQLENKQVKGRKSSSMSSHDGITEYELEEDMEEEKEIQEQLKIFNNMQKTKAAAQEALKSRMTELEENNPQYPDTPSGDKKLLPSTMPKHYSHVDVEKSWSEWWEKTGYFSADSSSSKPTFTAILPPPNVTGALHIGHALTAAIQDTIVRWKRMSGYNTLWVPGIERLEEGNLDPAVANEGQKMDFPKGIFECGADALRFSLVSYTAQSNKVNLDIERVVGYQQWCNKLWNAVRFALSKLGDNYTPPTKIVLEKMPSSCQWIISVLNKAISKTISSLDSYEFLDASSAVYSWWKYQLCDIFIEVIKPYFNGEDAAAKKFAQDTLWVCLDYGLRLLHLFMPYVTEELWQRLPSPKHYTRKESIMICEYPSVEESWTNEKLENEMEMIESAVRSFRSCRANLEAIEPNKRYLTTYLTFPLRQVGFVIPRNDQIGDLFRRYEMEVSTLAKLSSLKVLTENDVAPAGCSVSIVNEALSVHLKFEGTIDINNERENLRAKLAELQKQLKNLNMAMSAKGYAEQVPSHIKEEDYTKLVTLMTELLSIEEAIQHVRRGVSASDV